MKMPKEKQETGWPTFWNPWLQSLQKINRRSVAYGLKFLVVGDVDMRAKVMGRKAQTDDQSLVSEDLFFIAKNWVCELRVETRNRLGLLVAGLDNGDLDGVIGVASP